MSTKVLRRHRRPCLCRACLFGVRRPWWGSQQFKTRYEVRRPGGKPISFR